ncbi:MAG: hypothetical protein Q9174_004650 [Haloplaca sp. 1 TL-2023]
MEFGRKLKRQFSGKKRGKARESEDVDEPGSSMQLLNIREESSELRERVSLDLLRDSDRKPEDEVLPPGTTPESTSGGAHFQVPSTTKPKKLRDQKKPVCVYEHFNDTRHRATADLEGLEDCNTDGLERIKMIGTEQFSAKQLTELVESTKTSRFADFDMRQEFHGFIDGVSISWYAADNYNWGNVEKADDEIEGKELKKLRKLASRDGSLDIWPRGHFKTGGEHCELSAFCVENLPEAKIQTEKELVEEHKNGVYYRFPVPDHARPHDDMIDRLVEAMREVASDKDITLIVHCHGGMGRTTLAMTMFDMLYNAKDVSYPDIVKRQIKLRRREESSPTMRGKEYKAALGAEKTRLMEVFHKYAEENPIGHKDPLSWSDWLTHMMATSEGAGEGKGKGKEKATD